MGNLAFIFTEEETGKFALAIIWILSGRKDLLPLFLANGGLDILFSTAFIPNSLNALVNISSSKPELAHSIITHPAIHKLIMDFSKLTEEMRSGLLQLFLIAIKNIPIMCSQHKFRIGDISDVLSKMLAFVKILNNGEIQKNLWNIITSFYYTNPEAIDTVIMQVLEFAYVSEKELISNPTLSAQLSKICVRSFGPGDSWRSKTMPHRLSHPTDPEVSNTFILFVTIYSFLQ